VLSGEATHTNFVVFSLTRSGLEPTIYHTQQRIGWTSGECFVYCWHYWYNYYVYTSTQKYKWRINKHPGNYSKCHVFRFEYGSISTLFVFYKLFLLKKKHIKNKISCWFWTNMDTTSNVNFLYYFNIFKITLLLIYVDFVRHIRKRRGQYKI
jgi:hypothetical protein